MPINRYQLPQLNLPPPQPPPRRGLTAPRFGAAALGGQLPATRAGAGASALRPPAYGPRAGIAASGVPQMRYGPQQDLRPFAAPIGAGASALTPPTMGAAANMYSGYSVNPERNRVGTPAGLTAPTYGQPAGATAPYGDWRDAASKWALNHGGDPEAMMKRVVDVYMSPSNLRSTDNPYQALGNAIADDVWAQGFVQSIGRAPNDVEWNEHAYSVAYGTRDPLEGHPEAAQFIQGEMKRMQQENVRAAQEQWQQMMGAGAGAGEGGGGEGYGGGYGGYVPE